MISTFGAMCAPDHAGAAAELVRVCRPGGRVLMTTWVNDGFVGEMFSSRISRELVVLRVRRGVPGSVDALQPC